MRALVIGATLWPALLGAAVWERAAGGHDAWTPWLYVGCAEICHQRPERSFSTAGVQWPVCGRCSGLYLAAPIGAWLAIAARRRPGGRGPWFWLGVAAAPTVVSVSLEWSGWHAGSSAERAIAALPFGVAAAFWIVSAARGEPAPIRYTDAS